ncbi:hypothetical protein GCM10009596_11480 [Arthrobacter rhombi]|uniref:hypothetical protein n=1 Tax=Arthrobacter rhombi TaxID=71253 RepID=UPI0031D1C08F
MGWGSRIKKALHASGAQSGTGIGTSVLKRGIAPLPNGKYAVTLPSRGITVVANDSSQARLLDDLEAVIEANS